MRISDWSSDVCSSDLLRLTARGTRSRRDLRPELGRRKHIPLTRARRKPREPRAPMMVNRCLARLRDKSGLSSLLRHLRRAPPVRHASMAASVAPELSGTIQALRRHFSEVVLPLWIGRGFNEHMGLPYESLAGDSGLPLAPQRYRAMACARQLYVYASSQIGRAHV